MRLKVTRRSTIIAGVLIIALVTACATHRTRLWAAPDPVQVEGESVSGWGPDPAAWASIRVAARAVDLAPDDKSITTVGRLVFRGGLELQSDDRRFGGLSGLHVEPDGRLLAVSDQGRWFAAKIVLDAAGDLKGIVDPRVADLRDTAGAPFTEKEKGDAEDIARLDDGRFAVSFEQTHSIRLYDLDGKGPSASADAELKLAGTAALEPNASLESLALYDAGLITAGEGGFSRNGPFWIVPLQSETPPSPVGITSTNPLFSQVSLARLPDGDYLAMERFYAPVLGARIHVRRLKRAGLAASPARWEGEAIADLAPPIGVDNFEGVAVTRKPDGGVRIYIVSDDNFSAAQRTLLYAFDLTP